MIGLRLAPVLVALVLPGIVWGQAVIGQHGMVASASGLASQVGIDILNKGGNAVDAACAVGFALAVVYPEAGNIGGGGFMLVRLANGRSVAIDYREAAPAAASRDMYLGPDGKVVPGLSLTGYRASGVPGTVAGLEMAHHKFGKLPWKMIVEPAIRLAASGFKLSDAEAAHLHSRNLSQFEESKADFQKAGQFYKPGDTFTQPDLAQTLQRIADDPRDFYTGKTAKLIATAMAGKGLITEADLKSYKPALRRPLEGTYRGYKVITMPPPSSGGVALLEMLNMLEPQDLHASGSDTAETDHLLVETMRRAFADRSQFMGDPDFVKVPVAGLISKKYAMKLAGSISATRASLSSEISHGNPPGNESSETTHFSVVDSSGNAVSNTYTLNFGFGSGVTIPGAGFLMNDEMDDFTSKPGVPNGFGLIQGASNAIAPHKRPLSSMTPTIVVKNGRLFMVIGSPGGPTIITTVLQVILNVIDHQMTIADAIAAPRLHHQWLPDLIEAEQGAARGGVRDALKSMGHRFSGFADRWGDAEGILVDSATGLRTGASDPRSSDAKAIGN